MKKFLAIFMVVAVVMGMAFVVMSSADEADFNYTVNVSDVVDGKVNVSIDVDVVKPLSSISMTLKVADGATIVEKLDESTGLIDDRAYFSEDCDVILSIKPLKVASAFNSYATAINGKEITFTAASTDGVSKNIGGSEGIFPSSMKGIISFEVNYTGTVDKDTVVVTYVKCNTGKDDASSAVKYNLPAAPTTTTEEPVVPTTTEEPVVPTTTEEPVVPTTTEEPVVPTTTEEPVVPTTTEEPVVPTTTEEPVVPTTTEEPVVPTTTEEPVVPTTTEEPVVPTTTEEPVVPTTTEEPVAPTTGEEVPTTTAKDPDTSDGSAMGMFAFIALAIASLACAVVVIIRRKRA